jgi:DNA repair photolyase
MAERYTRKSFESFLLCEQYPVLISNRVDPFAVSNYRQALPVMELLTEMEIPIAFQTKGGRGIDDALKFLKPSCWYISIATLDEDFVRQMEPGAPSVKERLELIEQLTAAGHSVSVGINPCVPEWLPEPGKLTSAIAERGAYSAWIEPLHLNAKQVKQMGPKGQTLMGEKVIRRAKKRQCPPEYVRYLRGVKQSAIASGLEIFSGDNPTRSNYWQPYEQMYPKLFPTTQGFVNHLIDSGVPDNALITLDQYLDYMLPKLPKGVLRIGHYVGSTAHDVCRDYDNWSNLMTYEELLLMLWNEGRIKLSPQRNRAFSRACDRAHDGTLVERFDQFGDLYLIFSQQGFDNYQIEV